MKTHNTHILQLLGLFLVTLFVACNSDSVNVTVPESSDTAAIESSSETDVSSEATDPVGPDSSSDELVSSEVAPDEISSEESISSIEMVSSVAESSEEVSSADSESSSDAPLVAIPTTVEFGEYKDSVSKGTSQSLSVIVLDQFEKEMDLPGEWSTTDGTISKTGEFVAPDDSGSVTVTFTIENVSVSVTIEVRDSRFKVPPTFLDEFDFFNDAIWAKTHMVKTNSGFMVDWDRDKAFTRDGNLVLALEPTGGLYKAGDIRMHDNVNPFTAKGYYETRAKVIAVNGVVSSFFTLHDKPDRCPWSEVDFEWLKESHKTHTNYIYSNGSCAPESNGNGGHFDNPNNFDANEDFHVYGFDVTDEAIIWYIDGIEIDRYNRWEGQLYSMPVKIMMNVWPTDSSFMTAWSGAKYTGGYREALYDYVAYWEGGKP